MTDHESPPIDVEQHDADVPDEPTTPKEESTTLRAMSAEIEFFTTALITSVGRFDRDPVMEFNRLHPTSDQDELPFAIDYARPFFQGLGMSLLAGKVVDWDHRLYGIRRDRWELLRDTIAGMAWVDQWRRLYTRCCFYELEMVDPTTFYRRGALLSQLPLFTITVFAVSSNRGFTYIAPAENPPRTWPFPKTEAPHEDMRLEAQRVLGPPLSPETLSRSQGKRRENPS